MSIDSASARLQLRSEERDATRCVLLKQRPAPPNGAEGAALGTIKISPLSGVKLKIPISGITASPPAFRNVGLSWSLNGTLL